MTNIDDEAICSVLAGWAEALRRKDIDGVVAHYAPDAVSFDLAPPLQHDRDALKRGSRSGSRPGRGGSATRCTTSR